MKRDDLIHPFISGNKWRKLQGIVRDAQKSRATALVTFGGAWSNHLLATACVGAQLGIKTVGFVRGETVSNAVLTICSLYGMELIFVSRQDYQDKRALFQDFQERQSQAYFIDEGGYSIHALSGVGTVVEEINENAYDHLFCACGTGTTLAGLSKAIHQRRDNIQLHGVPVLKGGDGLTTQIKNLYPDAAYQWHPEYSFGGYAKTKPELLTFIKSFCAQTGILIEPVYTGKLCYAVVDLIKKEVILPHERVLILHTGGLTGLLGMHTHFPA